MDETKNIMDETHIMGIVIHPLIVAGNQNRPPSQPAGRDVGDAPQQFAEGFLCIAGPGGEADLKAKRSEAILAHLLGGSSHVRSPQGAGDIPPGQSLRVSGWKSRARASGIQPWAAGVFFSPPVRSWSYLV